MLDAIAGAMEETAACDPLNIHGAERPYAWLLLAKQGGAANAPHLDVEKLGNLLENQLGADGKRQAQVLADQLLKRINPNTQISH